MYGHTGGIASSRPNGRRTTDRALHAPGPTFHVDRFRFGQVRGRGAGGPRPGPRAQNRHTKNGLSRRARAELPYPRDRVHCVSQMPLDDFFPRVVKEGRLPADELGSAVQRGGPG